MLSPALVAKICSSFHVDPILFFIAWYICGESSQLCAGTGESRACGVGFGAGRALGNEGQRGYSTAFPTLSAAGVQPDGFGAALWAASGQRRGSPSSVSPQGPPGGGGPPGTPIMPSPAGRSPHRSPGPALLPPWGFGGSAVPQLQGRSCGAAAAAPSPPAF